MSLYFFHYQDDAFFGDEVGQVFADAEGAHHHASVIALELAQDGERAGSSIIVSTDDEDDFEVIVPMWLH